MKFKKNIISCSLTLSLCFAGQQVLAHTEIKIPTVMEGTQSDNAFTIGHGCETKSLPVRWQSVLFPTVNPELIASDAHTINDISELVSGVTAGQVGLIQDKSIFPVQHRKLDTLGNTIGFEGYNGELVVGAYGRVPFQFTAPTINPSSCVTALQIEFAVADICVIAKPTIANFKVNLWIPDNGSQYAIKGNAQGTDGIGSQPMLQVNRDLVSNPLPSSCGAGYTAIVRPSAADIDANLGIRGWQY